MPTNLKDPWNETSQYFRYGRTCVKKCPENHTFVGKETNQHCWSWNCEKILHLQCLSECPENTYMYRNLCLSFCPGHLFLLGMALVESCPQQQHLHLKREVVVTENSLRWERTTTKSIFECVSNCREKLIQNNSCVDNCPVNEPYLRGIFCHNNTCGAKYELKTSRGIECLTECPEGTLHSTNKCTTKCPDELKFNSNSICVNQCPSSSPFGVDINKDSFSFYDKKSEFKCLAKCKDNKVYKRDEEACIYSYKCKDPDFVYAGQCLKSCPSGYKWLLSCFHQFAAIVCSVIVILLTLTYGYCCFPLFKETCSFITICRQYKKNNSSEDSAKNLLQLVNDEEPNDPVHPENTTAIDMADISVFQTFNSSYINNALEADINI
ncbi:uncharacterized protein LOC123547031 [Mercenaria mercenaria]|uniref:uncharacterized protein LOC123547031 n=1 Tax=Mercenaria mercenaria TaxID=6596 RepID=UPI00234F7636|nr:uncharacterized protein LOC123547031 [Mercenaria mercenaria]